jgi:transcriptional regulator with XRE-family HTH domain
LTRTSLTNLENGRQHPPLHTFCDLVEQLDVLASDLLPTREKSLGAVDVEAMAGQQVRGAKELAFITTGIGMTNEEKLDGDTKKKNRSTRRNTAS